MFDSGGESRHPPRRVLQEDVDGEVPDDQHADFGARALEVLGVDVGPRAREVPEELPDGGVPSDVNLRVRGTLGVVVFAALGVDGDLEDSNPREKFGESRCARIKLTLEATAW